MVDSIIPTSYLMWVSSMQFHSKSNMEFTECYGIYNPLLVLMTTQYTVCRIVVNPIWPPPQNDGFYNFPQAPWYGRPYCSRDQLSSMQYHSKSNMESQHKIVDHLIPQNPLDVVIGSKDVTKMNTRLNWFYCEWVVLPPSPDLFF